MLRGPGQNVDVFLDHIAPFFYQGARSSEQPLGRLFFGMGVAMPGGPSFMFIIDNGCIALFFTLYFVSLDVE